MSYTPEDQDLDPGVEKTLEGLVLLIKAIDARIRDHSRWRDDHISAIHAFRKHLDDIWFELTTEYT